MAPIYRRRRERSPVATALAVFVFLGACGSSEPPRETRIAACDLLRPNEVARVLGAAVDPATASAENATDDLAGRSGCAWSTTDHAKAVLVELVRTQDMATQVRRTGFSAAARYQAVRSDHPEAHPVPQLGQPALWLDGSATLHVLLGDSYLTFEVATTPPSDAEPIAVSLARLAITRMARFDRAD